MISREVDFGAKEEGNSKDENTPRATSSSVSWSRSRDPRIVRVSKAFGGKDRHSKVCTVRGLRDRRVRLSVPTAVQLYDLQEKLGLSQPSKVVDWLLDAAKQEIDELPPLQIPPNFNLHHMLASQQAYNQAEPSRPNLFYDTFGTNPRDDGVEAKEDERENWKLDGAQFGHDGRRAYVSSSSHSPNNAIQYNSFVRWEPSDLSLSHAGSHGMAPQAEDFDNFNVVSAPTPVFPYRPEVQHPYFPLNITNQGEFDPMASPLGQSIHESRGESVRPFHFSMAAKFLPSQTNIGDNEHSE